MAALPPNNGERCARIANRLIEAVLFFAEIFPEFGKVLEPVVAFVNNLGAKPLDQNRVNGEHLELRHLCSS